MRTVLAALIGLVSGIASGAFGIGGALLTTPAIRVFLDAPALVAVGTPLPVIIPTALTGLWAYVGSGFVDVRLAVTAAVAGGVFAVLGAYTTRFVAGEALLVATAAVIAVLSFRMLPAKSAGPAPRARRSIGVYLATGALSGFLSGLLGIGGGVVLVPVFSVLLRLPVKTALGTSLAVVAAQAIPGTVVHAVLGNIDWLMAGGLMIGVIPGARIGSRAAVAMRDAKLRTVVAAGMFLLAVAFGLSELRRLLA